jgi:fumarylpyruvate hydrolase
MTNLLFPAIEPSTVAIRGRSERLPVRRIFCVGRNYEAHAKEMGVAVDREAPFYFTKSNEHVVASGSTIPYPPGTKGRIELKVNGQTKQSSDLGLLIHDVPALIAHLSGFYHLQPGDLIYTGTPEGVGPVVAGDLIEGSIDGIGTITLQIGAAE